MKFKYTASTADGRIMEGEIEANSGAEVLSFLSSKGLKPISIANIDNTVKSKLKKWNYLGSGIKAVDKIFMAKHFALMLKAGTNLFQALDILITDTESPALRSFLKEVRLSLEKGQPFFTAFSRHPKYFSPVFVNLIKAGEKSGTLERSFDNLSRMLSRQEDLRRKIRSALIYPIILIAASFLILIFLVTFILPRIASIFLEGNMEIPTFSKAVFSVGLFLSAYIKLISIIGVILLIAFWYFFAKTTTGRRLFYNFLGMVPVVKRIVRQIAVQRFSGTLASLLKAGVPIIDALEITAKSVGNQKMDDSLMRIANEGVAKGLTMGGAFKRESAFPVAVSSLIAVSEKAGNLDEILTTLSTFYESEIESSIRSLITFIEPVLLVVIGVIVAMIALSIIVPVYQLVGQF